MEIQLRYDYGKEVVIMEVWKDGIESGYAEFYDVALAVSCAIALGYEKLFLCDAVVETEYDKQTA